MPANGPLRPWAARTAKNDRSNAETTAPSRIVEQTSQVRVYDRLLAQALVEARQERGLDRNDEVWEGVYVVPPLANNPHQRLVGGLTAVFHGVIQLPGRGQVLPGANISDRGSNWETDFRCPDVVLVLNGGRAVDCTTHWMGGPDFLVEVQSPGDETEAKLGFYSRIQVRELLIVHRDTRILRLYRHNGQSLISVEPTVFQGGKWLVSEVIPLAFRRRIVRGQPVTEVRRTDNTPGAWTV